MTVVPAVPVVRDFDGLAWFKSGHSGHDNACVTVAYTPEFTAVRDSKVPEGPVLIVPPAAWGAFVDTKVRP